MIFEDDETLQMYVEESLEHLSDIENDLLTIEEAGSDVDEGLINNVFRAAHSIKGGAGFMGLTVIKDLSHHLENILGLVRTGELTPNSVIITVLLRAFDKLRELISNINDSNDEDVTQFISDLVALTTESASDDLKESLGVLVNVPIPGGGEFSGVPQLAIDQARKEGKYVYLLGYDLIIDIQKAGKKPLDVINSLLKSGLIIDCKVDFKPVGTLSDDILVSRIPFEVLYATIIEVDMMSTLTDLDDRYIHLLPEDVTQEIQPDKVAVKPPAPAEPVAVPTPPPAPAPTPRAAKPKPAPPAKPAAKPAKKSPANDKEATQTFLRVNINLLDTLMTLAGELVLSRNQLVQGVGAKNERASEAAAQRIDMITSELQEAIMQTRMQPISNIFNKFTRVVRDLAQTLDKEVNLEMEGKEVELDKTIIESINDPLTHLVRNSIDHGIETPQERNAAGKPTAGTVKLKAYHEAGQVNIEIVDDGKGIDGNMLAVAAVAKGLITEQQADAMSESDKLSIIFLPGFSTAKEVTDVSGRGVGMDVVKTNLDKLGGIVDINSEVGKGTTIKIKLPLTLAIIPSQIITVGGDRYAIPQVNLDELLRIPASQVKDRIEKVGNANVVRLRGALLPLVNLSEVLGIQKTYLDPETDKIREDRRGDAADRRSRQLLSADGKLNDEPDEISEKRNRGGDRRYRAASAINIAVVSAGNIKYGLIVDQLHDSEEIVVKPLGRHLKDCKGYAGATIMGDGKVALIVDVASIAQIAELSDLHRVSDIELALKAQEELKAKQDRVSLLLFKNAEDEHFAAPLNLVERIERFSSSEIEEVGGKKVVQYRGGSLPILELSQVSSVKPLAEREQREIIVFTVAGKEVGLMVTPPIDAIEVALDIDPNTLKQPGIMGSTIIDNHTTLMVDIFEVIQTLNPEWFNDSDLNQNPPVEGEKQPHILFAEDSAFFRHQVTNFFEEAGYSVTASEDGLEAWNELEEQGPAVDLVVTDLEMPNMDGFELTSKIKTDSRFSHLKVVALTSLAGEGNIAKGESVGIDDYQIKLDREQLLKTVKSYLQ